MSHPAVFISLALATKTTRREMDDSSFRILGVDDSEVTVPHSKNNKNKTLILGNAMPVLGVKPKQGGTYFGYFSR